MVAISLKEKLAKRKKRGKAKKHPGATVGIVTLTKEQRQVIAKGNIQLDFLPNGLGVGRPKAFETPDALREAAKEYFEWSIANPLYRAEYKDGGLVSVPLKRIFTWAGFLIRQGASERYFTTFRTNLKKDNPYYSEFFEVIDAIGDVIRTQKFEGAASGFFNANLLAYDLGYKKDVAQAGASSPTVNINFGSAVDPGYQDALNQILDRLRTIEVEAEVMNNKVTELPNP
jgi:hypothetical protein